VARPISGDFSGTSGRAPFGPRLRVGAGDCNRGTNPCSQQRLSAAGRVKLNHWTRRQRIREVITGLNRLLRVWSGYFHYRYSSRVMGKLKWQVRDRVKRWRWCKYGKKRALWSEYPDERHKCSTASGRCRNTPRGSIRERPSECLTMK